MIQPQTSDLVALPDKLEQPPLLLSTPSSPDCCSKLPQQQLTAPPLRLLLAESDPNQAAWICLVLLKVVAQQDRLALERVPSLCEARALTLGKLTTTTTATNSTTLIAQRKLGATKLLSPSTLPDPLRALHKQATTSGSAGRTLIPTPPPPLVFDLVLLNVWALSSSSSGGTTTVSPEETTIATTSSGSDSSYNLCRDLKTQPYTASIPVVMYSLTHRPGLFEAAQAAGANYYVPCSLSKTESEDDYLPLARLVKALLDHQSQPPPPL